VADVDVARASAIQDQFLWERTQPSQLVGRQFGQAGRDEGEEVVRRVRPPTALGERSFPARSTPIAEVDLTVPIDDLDLLGAEERDRLAGRIGREGHRDEIAGMDDHVGRGRAAGR
jgi:hypothetical protein